MRPTRQILSNLPPTLRNLLAETQIPAQVKVNGWLKSVRSHKNVTFAEISDGTTSGPLQAVFKGKGRAIEELTAGSSVSLSGRLEKSKGSGQDLELVVESTKILGECDPLTYPIQKKHLPPNVLREHAHLRFRTTQTASIMRLRDALARDWHDWFEDNDFVHIHTPVLTSSDCEGAGEVFTLTNSGPSPNPGISTSTSTSTPSSTSSASTTTGPTETAPTPKPEHEPFFPRQVNLTVSSQLHLEAPTHSLSRTYTLSPSFRAEPSLTSRHLSEFYMLEAEIAFVDSLSDLLDLVEDGIRSTISEILSGNMTRHTRARDDLVNIHEGVILDEALEGGSSPMDHLKAVLETPFGRVTYTEAIDILAREHLESPFEHPPIWGEGLSSEHEKWLAGSWFNGPAFVTDYPATLKPFYMLPSSAATSVQTSSGEKIPKETVACFDLLFPHIGEMAGGSLREHRLPNLLTAIEKAGLKREDYEWYLDLRRFGSVPHGGWGMGWERWVCWVSGVGNIRDVVAFPRWKGNCRY